MFSCKTQISQCAWCTNFWILNFVFVFKMVELKLIVSIFCLSGEVIGWLHERSNKIVKADGFLCYRLTHVCMRWRWMTIHIGWTILQVLTTTSLMVLWHASNYWQVIPFKLKLQDNQPAFRNLVKSISTSICV